MVSGPGQVLEQEMFPTAAPPWNRCLIPRDPFHSLLYLPHTNHCLDSPPFPYKPLPPVTIPSPFPFILPTAWNLRGSRWPLEKAHASAWPWPVLHLISHLWLFQVPACPTFKPSHFYICSSLRANVLLNSYISYQTVLKVSPGGSSLTPQVASCFLAPRPLRVPRAGIWDPAPAEDLGLLPGQCPASSSTFSALVQHLTVLGTFKNSTAGPGQPTVIRWELWGGVAV